MVAQMPVEREESVIELCEQAVKRLSARLPGVHVSCHMRVGNILRAVASSGELRIIYEVRSDQGGICWRAAETGRPQLVDDVRADPDYMATDERVEAEIAVPVVADGEVLLVLDAEFTERAFVPEEADAVVEEAARLEAELGRRT